MNLTFEHPWFLLLLLPLLGWVSWFLLVYPEKRLRISLSYDPEIIQKRGSINSILRWLPISVRILAISCWILALARPQSAGELLLREDSGIDISLILDTSASMETEDFEPNRLEAAKQVCKEFIQARPSDRINLVIFAEDAFTYAPLTMDHDLLLQLLEQLKIGILPKEGTAMGSAIAVSINRFEESKSISKIIILVTDGANNRGKLDPLNSARLAASRGIRIYTVGVGKEEFLVKEPGKGLVTQKTDLDIQTLQKISTLTGGNFYRASEPQMLTKVFNEINQLEKSLSAGENDRRVEDQYPFFIKAGLVLFLLSLVFQLLSWYNPLEE